VEEPSWMMDIGYSPRAGQYLLTHR